MFDDYVAEQIAGYLRDLDTADRQEGEAVEAPSERLKEKVERLRGQVRRLRGFAWASRKALDKAGIADARPAMTCATTPPPKSRDVAV